MLVAERPLRLVEEHGDPIRVRRDRGQRLGEHGDRAAELLGGPVRARGVDRSQCGGHAEGLVDEDERLGQIDEELDPLRGVVGRVLVEQAERPLEVRRGILEREVAGRITRWPRSCSGAPSALRPARAHA